MQPRKAAKVEEPADPSLFIDRDLSLIQFQRRVFEEAQDPDNPLLERVKFLSILGSNVDEFLMFRGPELARAAKAGIVKLESPEVSAAAHHRRVQGDLIDLVRDARLYFRRELAHELAAGGIRVARYEKLTRIEREAIDAYFKEAILPILTPLAFDPMRPFPHMPNLSLNLAILIRDKRKVERFAHLQIPTRSRSSFRFTGGISRGERNSSWIGRSSGSRKSSRQT